MAILALILVTAIWGVTFVQVKDAVEFYPLFAFLGVRFLMATACLGLGAIAIALGDLHVPHGRTVWAALAVTGVFASALGYLFQSWAQRRLDATRTALLFSLEPVFAGIFGFALAGDRLGWLGWGGCVVIMAGIVVAEPAAADVLRR